MARKTIVIEFVVEDDQNQAQKRDEVRVALSDPNHLLHQGLKQLGWSGTGVVAYTVSNPQRTAHWQA